MKLHPRTLQVAEARHAIGVAVTEASLSHDLTAIEVMCVLADLTATYAKYPLRAERHPNDPEKRAGEE